MIGINQLRFRLAHPRVAQPHRYATIQLPAATNRFARGCAYDNHRLRLDFPIECEWRVLI